jgi:hypothetical protein
MADDRAGQVTDTVGVLEELADVLARVADEDSETRVEALDDLDGAVMNALDELRPLVSLLEGMQ